MFGKKRRAEKERMEREREERKECYRITRNIKREFRESGQVYKVNPIELEQRIEDVQTRRLKKGMKKLSEPLVERVVYIQLEREYIRRRLEELGYSQKEIELIMFYEKW